MLLLLLFTGKSQAIRIHGVLLTRDKKKTRGIVIHSLIQPKVETGSHMKLLLTLISL